eukprot:jgi/Chlat1/5940/Chrsp4S06268
MATRITRSASKRTPSGGIDMITAASPCTPVQSVTPVSILATAQATTFESSTQQVVDTQPATCPQQSTAGPDVSGQELFRLPVPSGFRLAGTVCSYGFFMAPPNRWHPPSANCPSGALQRPLRLASQATITLVLYQPVETDDYATELIAVAMPGASVTLTPEDISTLQVQLRRMLRLSDEDTRAVEAFHKLHAKAAGRRFGRMFRSPSLFEDLVKTILLCNTGWSRTLSMNAALCQLGAGGAFPTPAELSCYNGDYLAKTCGLGYRAPRIAQLAKDVASGKLNLEEIESLTEPKEVYARVKDINGFGPYSTANCLSHYNMVPSDSETLRHLVEHYKIKGCTAKNVEAVANETYAPYAPYQFLAFWFEIWESYEAIFGSTTHMKPETYRMLTGANMKRRSLAGALDAAATTTITKTTSVKKVVKRVSDVDAEHDEVTTHSVIVRTKRTRVRTTKVS